MADAGAQYELCAVQKGVLTDLRQMGTAAARNGLTIQYCMSYVRHILQVQALTNSSIRSLPEPPPQSLELPAVTQARASGDYHEADTDQWNVGTSSMLARAVGIAPSKVDNHRMGCSAGRHLAHVGQLLEYDRANRKSVFTTSCRDFYTASKRCVDTIKRPSCAF